MIRLEAELAEYKILSQSSHSQPLGESNEYCKYLEEKIDNYELDLQRFRQNENDLIARVERLLKNSEREEKQKAETLLIVRDKEQGAFN